MQCMGENRRGLIEYRRCDACNTFMKRNMVRNLILAENDDRWAIYEGIVKGNRMPPSARKILEQAFAADHRSRLVAGELYQTPDGEWRSAPGGDGQ